MTARALLYPNLMRFDEDVVDREQRHLSASGCHTMHLTSAEATSAGDRRVNFDLGSVAPGATRNGTLVLSLDAASSRPALATVAVWRKKSADYRSRSAQLALGDATLEHLYRVSLAGLRAAVATSGKMDDSTARTRARSASARRSRLGSRRASDSGSPL